MLKNKKKKLLFVLLVIVSTVTVIMFTVQLNRDSKTKTQLVHQSLADMVFVHGGSYVMGSVKSSLQSFEATPPHEVLLNSFYISKQNVSYGNYSLYARANGEDEIQKDLIGLSVRNDVHPVNNIQWQQANRYCKWLSNETDLLFSLPSEAQWEYVARNGGKQDWSFPTSNGKQVLGQNFPSYQQLSSQKNSAGIEPLPVGSIPCTPKGICGLTGEVNQWMKDWYSGSYYSYSPVDNPQGPKTGSLKVIRGAGVETDSPQYAYNFRRYGVDPKKHYAGFRCVINTDMPPEKFKAYIKKFEK